MREFTCHKIRSNHGSQRPRHVLFLDTETQQVDYEEYQLHTVYMGWTVYCRYNDTYNDTQPVWRFHTTGDSICSEIDRKTAPKQALYVVGHNVFFDLQAAGFFRYFTDRGWRLDFLYDKGLTYILVIKKYNMTIKCLSTTNWYDFGLSHLGQVVGLPKKEVDLQHDDYATIKDYCRTDTDIVRRAFEAYISFIDTNDCGSFGMTRSSQAFRAYRHRFMHQDIYPHSEPDILLLERRAYIGGRTEAYYIGTIDQPMVYNLDVNSMYPYVMKQFEYPYKLSDVWESPTVDQVRTVLLKYAVCADVVITTDQPVYAVRKDDKIVFPIGTFHTTLCTGSLSYAIDHNHVKSFGTVAIYHKADLFTSFIDHFYPLKAQYKTEGNMVFRELTKKMLNSLYGKFGQKQPIVETKPYDGPMNYARLFTIDLDTGERELTTIIMNTELIETGEIEGKDSFTAIAAHITDYARLHLWNMQQVAGRDNVYYCDTDSLFVNETGYQHLQPYLSDTQLGAMGVEKVFKQVTIHGAKDYEVDGQRKCKGVPDNAKQVDATTYRYTQFFGQATHLHKQVDKGFLTRTVDKILRREYTKGNVAANGRVTPLWFVSGK